MHPGACPRPANKSSRIEFPAGQAHAGNTVA